MNRLLSCLAIGVLVTVLSGCNLVSKQPLLAPESGQQPLGDAPLAIRLQTLNSILTDAGGFVHQQAQFKDGHYAFDAWLGEQTPGWFTLHPTNGAPFDYLMQVVTDHTTYYALKLTDDHAYAMNIDLTPSDRDTLARLGATISQTGTDSEVADATALQDAVRVWTVSNRDKLGNPQLYPAAFELARNEAQTGRLMIDALAQVCLAAAGRPGDPDVIALPGRLSRGVAIDKIDTVKAEPFCAFLDNMEQWGPADLALVESVPDSVRLAHARSVLAKGDSARGTALLHELDDKGYPYATLELADAAIADSRPDDAEALMAAGAKRSAVLQYYYGQYLLDGEFDSIGMTLSDPIDASYYFEKAADAGEPLGLYGLGRLYMRGEGVDKDEARGFEMLSRAAAAGVQGAAFDVASAQYFGTGTPQDYAAAFAGFGPLAAAGIPGAEYMLGFMYSSGQGTTQDDSTAFGLLDKALDDGNVAARAEVGRMTYFGLGTKVDQQKGRQLLEAAREAGDDAAKLYLSRIDGQAPAALPGLDSGQLPPVGAGLGTGIAADVQTLAGGEAVRLTGDNKPFMAGLADYLAETCGLPESATDRAELATMILGGTLFSLGGVDFSNPDFGAMMGQVFGTNAGFLGGNTFASQLDCTSTAARNIADGLVKSSRGAATTADAGPSVFVSSCTPSLGAEPCGCLAKMGQDVMPDIYDEEYDRGIIPEIVSRNPLLGFTIGMTCGISDY